MDDTSISSVADTYVKKYLVHLLRADGNSDYNINIENNKDIFTILEKYIKEGRLYPKDHEKYSHSLVSISKYHTKNKFLILVRFDNELDYDNGTENLLNIRQETLMMILYNSVEEDIKWNIEIM